ncbi:chromatin structure-remodeling complex subunit RSC7 [Mucor velutinosus]|uniref:Chromatin structure-remodeling complex subunit RSC7 n=1 Tax=Mucor velutinosus TaxID=708070 RepID=A0AAN7HTG4_9FUNG|nr:chromatin structure-remodeling complex subunit RSC7 [Mucor velutinosus]
MSWQALDISNNQNYKSDDDYQTESDSEYEDIEITGWGDNVKKEATWNTLIDPSVKVKAGGIGSGDLHRRGGNFKPLSEAAILAQRLSKGIPSKKSSKPKKSKKKSSVHVPPKPAPVLGRVNRPYVPKVKPSVPARAPIKDLSASTWGSAPLSDTPFWEKNQNPPKPIIPATATTTTTINTNTYTPAAVASFTRQQSTVPQLPVFGFKQLNISQSAKATHEPVDSKSFAPNSFQNNTSWGSKAPIEIEYSLMNPPILTPKTKTLSSKKLPAFSVAPAVEHPIKEADNQPAISINTTNTKWNIEAQGFTPIAAKTETPKWNVDAQGFIPTAKTEASKWNASVPSFVPSTASTSTSSSAQSPIPGPAFYNADAPAFVPTFVPPPSVKKILKITSPNAAHTDNNTTATNNTTTANTLSHAKSRVHLDQSLLRRHLDIKPSTAQQTQSENPHTNTPSTTKDHQHQDYQLKSQTQPESTRGFEREPFLRIHLEISEGISTSILVEEGSNPESLAEEFGVTHKLKMTPKAKASMAAFIARLIDEKKNKAKHGLLD